MKSCLHGNHDNHSTTECFSAISCKNVLKNYKISDASWVYNFQLQNPKLCGVIDLSLLILKMWFFMGVNLPDFREGQMENRDKTGNAQFFRALKDNFYCLSLNGKNTPHFPFWPQMPSLTLELSQETQKKLCFWTIFLTFFQI